MVFSWDHIDITAQITRFNKMNPLNVTNEKQLLETFIIITALHVSGTSRPSSGAYKSVRAAYSDGMR